MKKSLELINERIYQAVQRRAPSVALKSPGTPRLVAVSKYQPLTKILECYEYGQRHFGENYINELFDKSTAIDFEKKCQDIRWHFIGHLQKNKINKLLKVPNLYILETVDSKALAQLVNQAYEKQQRQPPNSNNDGDSDKEPNQRLKVMIQVNTSDEEAKSGVSVDEVIPLGEFIWNECKALELCGLMTIGKLGGWTDDLPNKDFITLFNCREKLCKHLEIEPQYLELSMGMSDAFEEAVSI